MKVSVVFVLALCCSAAAAPVDIMELDVDGVNIVINFNNASASSTTTSTGAVAGDTFVVQKGGTLLAATDFVCRAYNVCNMCSYERETFGFDLDQPLVDNLLCRFTDDGISALSCSSASCQVDCFITDELIDYN